MVQSTGGSRGLNNIWFVFLPPGVDECLDASSCGTNSFAGYHAVSNVNGHGVTVYALAIDPIIEAPVPSGADPEGFPDAEVALDIAAHEVNEAMADPEGNGWMDPNGAEVGDKCDAGPQVGTPLGFAANGSPYNQVINGHRVPAPGGVGQRRRGRQRRLRPGQPDHDQPAAVAPSQSGAVQPVHHRQRQPARRRRDPRSGIPAARRGPAAIRSPWRAPRPRPRPTAAGGCLWRPHAVGDDRDEIDIDYSGAGAPQPNHQVILTGNGGNPFTEAGWMGWTEMDRAARSRTARADPRCSWRRAFRRARSASPSTGQPPPSRPTTSATRRPTSPPSPPRGSARRTGSPGPRTTTELSMLPRRPIPTSSAAWSA